MGLVLAGEIVLLGRKWYNSGSGLACLSQTSKTAGLQGPLRCHISEMRKLRLSMKALAEGCPGIVLTSNCSFTWVFIIFLVVESVTRLCPFPTTLSAFFHRRHGKANPCFLQLGFQMRGEFHQSVSGSCMKSCCGCGC